MYFLVLVVDEGHRALHLFFKLLQMVMAHQSYEKNNNKQNNVLDIKNVVFTKSPVCKVPDKIERIEVPLSSVPLMDLQPLKHILDVFYLEVA